MTSKHLYTYLIGAILVIGIYSMKPARVVKSMISKGDTIPSKQYVIIFNPSDLYRRLDSASAILQYIGTSMSVDNAAQIKVYYYGVISRLAAAGKIDSIEIKRK